MKRWIHGQRQRLTCQMPLCKFLLKLEMFRIMVNCSLTLIKFGLDMRRLRVDIKGYGRDVGSS